MSPTSVPTSSQAEARAKLVEQSRRHKLREQRKAEASREQQDMALRRQIQREEEDLPRLKRAAELCRLAESLRVVMVGIESQGIVGTQPRKDAVTQDQNCADKSGASRALELYSVLVCAGLDERCEAVLEELKVHRNLASRTTSFATQVDSSEDDPYLGALSNILLYADSLIEKLILGEYAVASSETAHELATKPIAERVEAKTSETLVFVLNAFFKDRRIDTWVKLACESRQPLSEVQVADLDQLLHDLMQAQQYCGHFTRMLSSLGVLDPARLAEGGIAEKQVDLASAYIRLEEAWLSACLSKARAIADVTGEGQDCVNSLVKDTFYIVRKGFARSVYTENSQSCSAMANHIFRLIEDEYSTAIKAILSGAEQHAGTAVSSGVSPAHHGSNGSKVEGANGNDEENNVHVDLFAAALDGDIHGTTALDSPLLIAINTIELSSIFMNDLVNEMQHEIAARFPDQLILVDMALQGLRETANEHKALRTQALEEVVTTCFQSMLLSAADVGVNTMTYVVNNQTYELYEREDPFVSKFVENEIEQSRIFKKCRTYLSRPNFITLLGLVAREVAKAWEAALVKHQEFNDLGALRLADEIRAMMSLLRDLYLSHDEREQAEFHPELLEHFAEERDQYTQQIRKHFARLLQISFLLSLELTSHVELVACPFTPVLSEDQVRRVLRRRVPPEPGVDIRQLDVSAHVASNGEHMPTIALPPMS